MSKSGDAAAAGRGKPYTPSRGRFAGRTFPSKHQYRTALAAERGFASPYKRQSAPRSIRSVAQLEALNPAERQARRLALRALDLMRDGVPLNRAARRAGTTPSTVIRYVGSALERRGGRWGARPADRLLRVMRVLGEGGREDDVVIRGSRVASLISEHWFAVDTYLLSGDEWPLLRLRGRRVAGIVLETDPDRVSAWERRGELAVEDIYSLTS